MVGVQTGDLVQRWHQRRGDGFGRFVQMQAMEVVRTVVMVCTAISIMLPISGAMTAVSTCLLPILVVFSFFYFRGVQRQFTRSDEAEGRAFHHAAGKPDGRARGARVCTGKL